MRSQSKLSLAVICVVLILSMLVTAQPVAAFNGASPPVPDPDKNGGIFGFLSSISISDILAKVYDFLEGKNQKLDEVLVDSSFSETEKAEIARYSGGKTPAEMTAQFCQDSSTSDAQAMLTDIRQSYAGTESDPHSPLHLLDIFEKMGSFCK